MSRRRDGFPCACSWSWDGKKIALAADDLVWWDTSALYVLHADGSGLRRVPHTGKVYSPVRPPH